MLSPGAGGPPLRVCISIPTKGNIRAETVEWLLRAFVELAPNVEVQIVNDPRPLQHVRNVQAQRFLASACTHLFLLDADCVPKPGTVQRLVAYGLPIVAAPHATMIDGELGVMAVDRRNGHYVQHRPIEGLQRVDAVGGSGLLIERRVLEEIGPPYFRFEYDGNGLLSKGEDFCFCEDATQLGYEIWADCELVQGHVKEVTI